MEILFKKNYHYTNWFPGKVEDEKSTILQFMHLTFFYNQRKEQL